MTDCPNGDVRDLLPDLVHDRLAPEVRRDVEAHVRTCADCQEELALLRAMRASLRRGPAVSVGAIAAAIPAYRAPARRSWAGWRTAAAVVILAAGGTSAVVLGRAGPDGADSLRGASGVEVTAPAARAAEAARAGAAASPGSRASAPRELAMGNSAIGDLDDGELSALLKDLETLDVLPAAEVENGASVSPVGPAGTE